MALKYEYDQAGKNDPEKKDGAEKPEKEDIVLYETEGHARNICFVLADGKQVFLNYAYLISGDYFPEENRIMLVFSSHKVTLEGYNLDLLFKELIDHVPRSIKCVGKRYNAVRKQNSPIVNKIIILPIAELNEEHKQVK